MPIALITGAHGTVGRALVGHLHQHGSECHDWQRSETPPLDQTAAERLLTALKPDVLYHLAVNSDGSGDPWQINVEWPRQLAALCREQGIMFVFTSTVMVFSDNAQGPFTPDSVPDAAEGSGYGWEKLCAERSVQGTNPEARIVRLGWQIGSQAGSNNMVDFMEQQIREKGHISVSNRFLPACSCLEDTAAMLAALPEQAPGLYLGDSNRGWNLYQIACALKETLGRDWQIEANEDFVFDQRMQDERLSLPSLKKCLPELP